MLIPGSLQCQQRAEAEQRKELRCRRQLCHLLLELQPLAEGRALGGEETAARLLLEQRQARNRAVYRSEQAPACPRRTAAARHCPAPAAHPRLRHLQGTWRHSGPLLHAGNLGINTYIVCTVLGDGGDGGKAQLCRAHAVPALSSLRSLPPSQFPAHPLPFCSFLGGILLNDGYCKFTSGCEFPIIAKQRVPALTRGTWMTPGHQ